MTIHQRRYQRLMRVSIPVPEGAGPRACLEAQISLLISLLDYMDPDPDLEENGDLEPSLGPDYQGCTDLEEDGADTEPSLGSRDQAINQEFWSKPHDGWIGLLDHELDDCDDEDGGDTEHDCDDDTDNTDDTPIFWPHAATAAERQATVAASQRLLATANRLRGVEARP